MLFVNNFKCGFLFLSFSELVHHTQIMDRFVFKMPAFLSSKNI